MGVRNIKKQLAGVEDLLLGEGTQVQERNSGSVPITKINLVGIVDTVEALATLDITKYTTAIVKDLDRGGTFEWSATGTANGGTVFAGATGFWNRQYSGAVNVKWFGAVGTADDTSVFQAAFNSGFNVQIPDGTYNVGNLTLDTENQTIFSNRVIFNALNNTDYVLTVNAKYVVIGNLDFSFSNAISVTTYRGLNILNSFFAVNKIIFTCVNKGAGTRETYNAVNIGDGTTQLKQIKIGYLGTYGFDYPYYINYVDNIQIDYLKCEFYRRGTYLKDCTNIDIETLWAGSISPNTVGSAGENALLIEATKAHDSARGINIDNIVVKGSGEHGVRLGGQYTIDGFFCNSMYIKDTGSGVGTGIEPDNHGGCGFKVLGPTTLAANIKHKNIVVGNITVENVVNVTNPDRLNFAGVQLGKCEYVQIDNVQVIPKKVNGVASTFSARSGLEITGCNDILIGELKVVNPKYAGLYLYSGSVFKPKTYEYNWGANKNIKISNVSITDADDAIVFSNELDYTANMENITIENVDIITANRALYVYEVTGGYKGTFTNCHVSFKADTITGDLIKAPLVGIVIDAIVKNATIPLNRVGANGTKILDLDKNLTYAIGDANVKSFAQQSKSMQFYIEDDSFTSFDTCAFPHFISVAASGVAEYAQLWVRPTSSPANIALHEGTSIGRLNTALNGTTGIDGKLTIGIQNGKIYIENRLGATAVVIVSDMV